MKPGSIKRLRLLLPAVALAVGALLGPAATVASATGPTCSGSSCEGKNAEATGCSVDQIMLDDSSETKGGSDLKLYYSPTCGTVWTMYTQVGGSVTGTAEIITVPSTGGLESVAQEAYGDQVGRVINGNVAIESGMTQYGQSFKACGMQQEPSNPIDPQPDGVPGPTNLYGWCTGWH